MKIYIKLPERKKVTKIRLEYIIDKEKIIFCVADAIYTDIETRISSKKDILRITKDRISEYGFDNDLCFDFDTMNTISQNDCDRLITRATILVRNFIPELF